ncbi:hypothetical protein D9M71_390780 [compost metagenome]
MRQLQLRAQLVGTGVQAVLEAVALDLHQLRAQRLEQSLQLGITRQIGALHLQGHGRRRTRRRHETRGQPAADRLHHRIGQGIGIVALRLPLLAAIAHPQAPLRLPFAGIVLLGIHRQDRIGAVTLRGAAQRVGCGQAFRSAQCLLAEISQRQAQRYTAALRGPIEWRGRFLVVAHQTVAGAALVQPPGQHGRPAGAPDGQPGAAQGGVGRVRIEIHHQRQRRAIFEAVLADQLLRVLEITGQRRVLERLLIAGQA